MNEEFPHIWFKNKVTDDPVCINCGEILPIPLFVAMYKDLLPFMEGECRGKRENV